jgi:hypothetical protein
MLWWFFILGFSTLIVVIVAIAIYLRVRRHMKAADTALKGTVDEVERRRQTDGL